MAALNFDSKTSWVRVNFLRLRKLRLAIAQDWCNI